jgi:MFS family permease
LDQPVGYRQLLRENEAVRSVWLSQIFGQSGDWLNLIALFTLVGRGTEPATAIAVILSLHYLCPFFWGPLAGMAADRFNKRTILIVSDAIRIPIVLGFIWFGDSATTVFLLEAIQYSAGAFFEPTRTALTQELAQGRELLAANSLGMATYGASGALGMVGGGLLIAGFGTNVCFIADAITFALSIYFLAQLKQRSADGVVSGAKDSPRSWKDLFALLAKGKRLSHTFLVKFSLGLLGGGYWVIVVRYAQDIFAVGESGSISNGIINGCMFVGAFVASFIVNRWLGDERHMPRAVFGILLVRIVLMIVLFGAPFLLGVGPVGIVLGYTIVIVAVFSQTIAGASGYILSTQILKDLAPSEFHGRIFALDLGLMNLGFGASAVAVGTMIDSKVFTLIDSNLYIAACLTPLALLWLYVVVRWNSWWTEKAGVEKVAQ